MPQSASRFAISMMVLLAWHSPYADGAEAQAQSSAPDVFAQIAGQRPGERIGSLKQPQPPELPDGKLPWSAEVKPFVPADKLDAPEELQAELARQRERYLPFLADLAPKLPEARLVVPVNEWDWRVETAQDQKDFVAVLAGQGAWQRVKIPHFGPPLGRAATYYRTTFQVTQAMLDQGAVFVRFEGVDYKAHVFVNGGYLGSHEGFFAPFEFEFTPQARVGENVLLVKVENDFTIMGSSTADGSKYCQGDKIYAAAGLGYDEPKFGWHNCPPGMGIYQGVAIEARSRLHVHDIFVRPIPDKSRAEAWIEVFNCDTASTNILLELSVYGQNFEQEVFTQRRFDGRVEMAADDSKGSTDAPRASRGVNYFRIAFDLPQFRPWELESPWLYKLQVRLLDSAGHVLDARQRQFGMRSFRMDTAGSPKGQMFFNDRPIRLRGANTMGFEQQAVLHKDFDRLRDDILLAKICHMNYLRLTQRPVQQEVYEYCDRLGIMTQTDLPLFGMLRRNQFCEAVRQAEEMERLVRAHPCNIMDSYINEPVPNGHNEPHRFLIRPELEGFFAAADRAVLLANPDRVIKPVDGDYDQPAPGLPDNHCYPGWYNGHGVDLGLLAQGYWQRVKSDWLYGCGEFGAEGLDSVETMRRHCPKDWLPASPEEEATWTPDRISQSQTGRFHYLWFETQHTLEDWVRASQTHQAWVTRLMTEAFRRDRRMNSFAIHLFIDAFPTGWMKTIMDVDRRPKPAFYAYRDALEPVAANLNCGRKAYFSGETVQVAAWLCNDTAENLEHLTLRYQVECQGKTLCTGETAGKAAACDSVFQGWLECAAPDAKERTTFAVRLGVFDEAGKLLHDAVRTFDLFGPPPAAAKQTVRVIGTPEGKAARLATELGCEPAFEGDLSTQRIIVIDDLKAYAAAEPAITAAVQAGARAIFVELPVGEHQLAGGRVTIERCGMNPVHFVSRDTGHPLVAGFAPDDFKFWCDVQANGVRPLLSTILQAEGWNAALLTAKGNWGSKWEPTPAVAEKKDGQGSWILCQLHLQGRTVGNPVAAIFARRLLTLP